MHTIDWWIIGAFLAALLGIAAWLKKYTRSVADFLVAGRCAKRYLLTAAEGAAGLGAISIVAQFEMYNVAGFTGVYWQLIIIPLWLILALTGWIIYRFRQTRCMTMAQFLELRYGRSFRIFSGLIAWISGILNYGIFPAVTARFFIYSMGLPVQIFIGGLAVPTFVLLMFFLLAIALYITLNGGQIVIIVTDFFQGQIINVAFFAAAVSVLARIHWSDISDVLSALPAGESQSNPFDTTNADTFSVWFFLIILFGRFYGYMCWQGISGYNASAKTPHEARMSKIIGQWRIATMTLIPVLFSVGAYVLLHHTAYANTAESICGEIARIDNPQIQKQMLTPVALRYLLPCGLFGLWISVMLAAAISTDSTYLHSWGSIFIQDVVMPFRKTPLAQKTHLKLLRLSILGVAVFVFFFSLLFRQTQYIILFFQLTGALFSAGAGTCIIGGLYWRRGTVAGAWAAMTAAVILVLTGFTLERVNPDFPLNYIQMVFVCQLTAVAIYVTVSLLSGRGRKFDLDHLLHRRDSASVRSGAFLQKRLGLSEDFSSGDKVIYFATIGLCIAVLGMFFGLPVWNFIAQPEHDQWMVFWCRFVRVSIVISAFTTVWLLIGGMRDLKDMLHDLKTMVRSSQDDGFVVHDQTDHRENNSFAGLESADV